MVPGPLPMFGRAVAHGVGVPQRGALWRRWLSEERGQDLIEYALLSGAIGLAGVAAFAYVSSAMHDTYEIWDSSVQSDALVEVPDPAPVP